MHSSWFFQIKPIARLILKRKFLGSHMISYQSLLLSTTVLNDVSSCVLFKPRETRYSTFNRELLAVYLAVKYFRYFVKGRQFHVLTDHKPLVFALQSHSDRYTPRQLRHLDFISQFTSDICQRY